MRGPAHPGGGVWFRLSQKRPSVFAASVSASPRPHRTGENDSYRLSIMITSSRGPHPFTLRQLQYAVAVADDLSFSRAAERCHVSQPSLSAQLAQLEDALGVRLFERTGKPVILTTAGREIVERARRLVVDADDLGLAARRVSDPLAGTIRLGVIPTISPYLLPSITPALRKGFPRLTVAWLEEKTDALMKSLAEGAVEGAIVALEAEVGDVEREIIARDPFVLVAPPDHALAKKKAPVSSAELKGAELMLLDEGHCFRSQALEVCGAARAHECAFRATSLSTLVQMVAGGAGITLLPALAVAAETARAGLRVRPLAATHARRTIAMVWRKRSPLAGALREISGAIREAYPARA
jgi:LysR family hydrogen peroxide-inducible transcriptional activator